MSDTDDERARERAVILQRRAKLVAYAVAAGVATAACSGNTVSCLSLPFMGGTAGTPVTSGGRGFCLTAPMGGTVGFGGTVSAATGGSDVQICLQPPIGGATSDPVAGANSGGEPSEGGAAGEGGASPVFCLVPPA
jgi:hypothetical protein